MSALLCLYQGSLGLQGSYIEQLNGSSANSEAKGTPLPTHFRPVLEARSRGFPSGVDRLPRQPPPGIWISPRGGFSLIPSPERWYCCPTTVELNSWRRESLKAYRFGRSHFLNSTVSVGGPQLENCEQPPPPSPARTGEISVKKRIS